MPVIGIIGLCGFYHKNGMTLVQLVRSSIRLMLQKPYVYETRNCLKEWEEEDEEKGTKRNSVWTKCPNVKIGYRRKSTYDEI